MSNFPNKIFLEFFKFQIFRWDTKYQMIKVERPGFRIFLYFLLVVIFIPLYTLSGFYFSLFSIISFHIFHIANPIFFRVSILPVFLIFLNYIFFTLSILPIFLIFFISHFLFPSFHTFNFSNSHFPAYSLSHTNSFSSMLSIIPFLLSFHISFHLTSFFPNSTSLYSFPKYSQQNTFCFTPTLFLPLHLPQLYTFFPLSPFFNLLPALDIFCRQCSVRGPIIDYIISLWVPYHLSPILPVPCSSSYFIS